MRTRHITAGLLALGLAVCLAGPADAGPTPKSKTKAPAAKTPATKTKAANRQKAPAKPVQAWGVTWQPTVEAALAKANGTKDRTTARKTTKRRTRGSAGAESGKPVLWMRVLGALTGDT